MRVLYACRAHRSSVAKFGGFPYIGRPMRKIFAAAHVTAHAEARPMPIVSHTCHRGGGDVDAIRIIMASVFTGGMKLSAIAGIAGHGCGQTMISTESASTSVTAEGLLSRELE